MISFLVVCAASFYAFRLFSGGAKGRGFAVLMTAYLGMGSVIVTAALVALSLLIPRPTYVSR